MKSRKAQIGATLTWVVATLIIVFIMFIFVGFASMKKLTDGKKSTIEMVGENKNLAGSQVIYAFLNSPISDNEKIRDLIYRYVIDPETYEEELEEKSSAILYDFCKDYSFAIGDDFSIKKGDPKGTVLSEQFKLIYNNKIHIIKYTQLKEC